MEGNVVECLVGRGDDLGAHLGGDLPAFCGKVTCDLPVRVPGSHEGLESSPYLRSVHQPVGGWGGDEGAQRRVGRRAHLDVIDTSLEGENQGREHVVVDETVATCPCAPLGAFSRERALRVAGVGEGKMQRYGDAFLREIAAYEEDEA